MLRKPIRVIVSGAVVIAIVLAMLATAGCKVAPDGEFPAKLLVENSTVTVETPKGQGIPAPSKVYLSGEKYTRRSWLAPKINWGTIITMGIATVAAVAVALIWLKSANLALFIAFAGGSAVLLMIVAAAWIFVVAGAAIAVCIAWCFPSVWASIRSHLSQEEPPGER